MPRLTDAQIWVAEVLRSPGMEAIAWTTRKGRTRAHWVACGRQGPPTVQPRARTLEALRRAGVIVAHQRGIDTVYSYRPLDINPRPVKIIGAGTGK